MHICFLIFRLHVSSSNLITKEFIVWKSAPVGTLTFWRPDILSVRVCFLLDLESFFTSCFIFLWFSQFYTLLVDAFTSCKTDLPIITMIYMWFYIGRKRAHQTCEFIDVRFDWISKFLRIANEIGTLTASNVCANEWWCLYLSN